MQLFKLIILGLASKLLVVTLIKLIISHCFLLYSIRHHHLIILIMIRSSFLNIHIHWHLLSPGNPNPLPKVVKCPSRLRVMLDKYDKKAYLVDGVNKRMTCSFLSSLLKRTLASKDHSKINHYTCCLDPDCFITKHIGWRMISVLMFFIFQLLSFETTLI